MWAGTGRCRDAAMVASVYRRREVRLVVGELLEGKMDFFQGEHAV